TGDVLDVVSLLLDYASCLAPGPMKNWSPHPELHRTDSHTKGVHRSKCFEGKIEIGARRTTRRKNIGVPDRLRSGDLLHEKQACWLATPQGQNGEDRRNCTFDLMLVMHPLC